MILLVNFLLSTGAIYSLIPVIVILALIAAGAGLRNRQDILAVLGVGTILGLSGGTGEGKGVGALRGFKYDSRKRKLSSISNLFKNKKSIPLKLQEKQQKPDTPPPEQPKSDKPPAPKPPAPEPPKQTGKKTSALGGETTQLVLGATGPLQAKRTTSLNGKATTSLTPTLPHSPTPPSPPPTPAPTPSKRPAIRSLLPSLSTSWGYVKRTGAVAWKAGIVAGFIIFPYAAPFASMGFNAASSTGSVVRDIWHRNPFTKINKVRRALNINGHGPLTKRESRQNLRESRRKYKKIEEFMKGQLKGYHDVNKITKGSAPLESRNNIISMGNIANASFYFRGSRSFRSNGGEPSEAMKRESELLTVTEYTRNYYLHGMKEALDNRDTIQWVPEPAEFERTFKNNLQIAKNISNSIPSGKNKNFKGWYLEMHSAFISKMRPQQLERTRETVEKYSNETKYGIASHRYRESKSLMARLSAEHKISEREALSHIQTLKNQGRIVETFYIPGSNLYYKAALNRSSSSLPPPRPPTASQPLITPPHSPGRSTTQISSEVSKIQSQPSEQAIPAAIIAGTFVLGWVGTEYLYDKSSYIRELDINLHEKIFPLPQYNQQSMVSLSLPSHTKSISINVTAANQTDKTAGTEPYYLLNTLTDKNTWYQIGVQPSQQGFGVTWDVLDKEGQDTMDKIGAIRYRQFSKGIKDNDIINLKIHLEEVEKGKTTVVTEATNIRTKEKITQTFDAYGATEIIGSDDPRSIETMPTSVMTEWYHKRATRGPYKPVRYQIINGINIMPSGITINESRDPSGGTDTTPQAQKNRITLLYAFGDLKTYEYDKNGTSKRLLGPDTDKPFPEVTIQGKRYYSLESGGYDVLYDPSSGEIITK